MERPSLRLLHHLARSGGTVISKCLAVMERAVVLSEIHPLGMEVYEPLSQAAAWYGLLSEDEAWVLRERGAGFLERIELIAARCRARGLRLIVRDWSHLDFHGVPWVESPSMRLLLAETTAPSFELIRFSTVRRPIEQWSSLWGTAGRVEPEAFMRGYLRFAELAAELGFVRYEDFVADPDATLRIVCARLDLEFDPEYRKKWIDYRNMTGNARTRAEISFAARPPPSAELRSKFERLDGYHRALELLGYPP